MRFCVCLLVLGFWGCAAAGGAATPPVVVAPELLATVGPDLLAAVDQDARTLFSHFDRNGDGQLSRAEAAALSLAGNAFSALDTDHDGSLSLAEFASPARVQALTRSFTALARNLVAAEDLDRDGRLSWPEYQLGMLVPWPGPTLSQPLADPQRASYDAADPNHLGYVTAETAPKLVTFLLRTGYHLQQRSH